MGSCIFNLLCVIGITAMVRPLDIVHIYKVDLYVMLAFTLLLLPMMLTRHLISRIEGTIVLAGYVGYCVYLWLERIDHAVPHV